MKNCILIGFLLCLLSTGSYAQKKILINDFTGVHNSLFEDDSPVTAKDLKGDIVVQLSDLTKVKSAKLYGQNGQPQDMNKDANQTPGQIRYVISDPHIENDELKFEISDGNTTKIVVIKVSGTAKPNGIVDGKHVNAPLDCIETKDKNFNNQFGEDITLYDDNTIVYIYDFNKVPAKRAFYKIYKVRDKDSKGKDDYKLEAKLVNWNKESIMPWKNVKFRIINVNRFMYNVEVDNSIINFDSEIPPLLSRMLIGDDTLLNGLMDSFSSDLVTEQSLTEDEITALEELREDIRKFIEKYNALQNKILEAYDPCASFPCCYYYDYSELANSLMRIKGEAAKVQLLMEDEKKIVTDNEKKEADCAKFPEDLKKIEADIAALDKAAPDYNTKLAALKVKKADLAGKIEICDKEKADYKTAITDAKNKLLNFTAMNAAVTSLPTIKNIREDVVFVRNMVDQNMTHSIDFMDLHGNGLDLTLNITSRDSVFIPFSLPAYKASYHIQVPVLYKPFVSFSSGSFIALGRDLLTKTYSWQPVTLNNTATTTGYTLTESGYSNPPAGFSALVNLEWKTNRSFGFGLSAGVGLTIEESPRLAYLAGGSLFFGDKRQLAVTGGFAAMQVDHISRSFETALENQTIYTTKEAIDYYKEFRIGAFISLTYTPFTISKNK